MMNNSWYNSWTSRLIETERLEAQNLRDEKLEKMVHTFPDGRIVQVRPRDLTNYQVNINLGEPDEWILADNTIAMLSVEEMQQAVHSGMLQGKQIWKEYKDKIKELGKIK